jgi:histidinol-phosphate aminotransferase
MIEFDRRATLRALGLAAAALSGSRLCAASAPAASTAPGAAAATPGGMPLARLSLNENPYGPSPAAVTALQRQFTSLCRYTGAEYDLLVGLIAQRERVPREQIILGEILEPLGTYLSLHGGPGGEFIYSDPGYTALIDSAVAVGGRAIGVPLTPRLENDLRSIAARVNPRTRAVFLVNPHNPTGIVSDTEQLKLFARKVSRQALVIVDEAYLEFADSFSERTLADLVRASQNVIVFRTFAKIYGLAGLDIGYGLLPAPIAMALSAQGLTNPHLFNRLAVVAAAASLQDAGYVAGVAQQVAAERDRWFELLTELKRPFTPSRGNFVFFDTGLPHAEFADALLKDGIEIGRAFPPYGQWARISIGLPEENAIARSAVNRVLGRAHL